MAMTHALLALSFLLFQDPAVKAPAKKEPASKLAKLPGAWGKSVRYRVEMNIKQQQWHVWMGVEVPKAGNIDVWLPRWTPGGYHLADFSQFVEDLDAEDDAGRPLKVVTVEDPRHWTIDTGTATKIYIHYIANHSSPGGFDLTSLEMEANRIKPDHAFVNSTSLFAFVDGMLDRQTEVKFDLPGDWKIASPLKPRGDGSYVAPNYYRLEDSPFLMSPNLQIATYTVDNIPHEVACVGRSEEQLKQYTEQCEKITQAARKFMGALPYDHYTFLLGFFDETVGGGGLEHTFSTLIVLNGAMMGEEDVTHVLAHEYFHLWNAERIRVNHLHKPDYTKPLVTGTIWLNEGATEYMSFFLLRSSGLMTENEFYQEMAKKNASIQAQKKLVTRKSIVDFSRKWSSSKLGGITGLMEIQFGVYERGAVASFALDLLIREKSNGDKGLVDVFKYLLASYWEKDKGYGEEELVEIIKTSTGVDAGDFYNKYIAGTELVDLDSALAPFGLTTIKTKKGRPSSAGFSEVENATEAQKALRARFLAGGVKKD
jgi:predicted metalloprotease with PDZ domain